MRRQNERENTEVGESREESSVVYSRICQKMQANVFGCGKPLK